MLPYAVGPQSCNILNQSRLFVNVHYRSMVVLSDLELSRSLESEKTIVMTLTDQQEEIISGIAKGQSLLIQGKPGTGKTKVLQTLRDMFEADPSVYLTSMTGISACVIGTPACTLHSFMGLVGHLTSDASELSIDKCTPQGRKRVQHARVLVIDEVSMLSARLFTFLERFARSVRRSDAPFGGLQLILCGDIYQLPPFPDGSEGSRKFKWFFEAEEFGSIVGRSWQETINGWNFYELKTALRHFIPNDAAGFAKQFSETAYALARDVKRNGYHEVITRLSQPKLWPKGVVPTTLFATRELANQENARQLEKLPGVNYVSYIAQDSGQFVGSGSSLTSLPETLTLTEGAPVILLKNHLHYGLCNGSQGVVISFATAGDVQSQCIPFLGKLPGDLMMRLPLVKFSSGQECFIGFETHGRESCCDGTDGFRTMVPLLLGFSMTISRSQGLTLDYVVLDCRKIWHSALLSVGMTRVRNPDWLEVRHFSANSAQLPGKVELSRFKAAYFPTSEARAKVFDSDSRKTKRPRR